MNTGHIVTRCPQCGYEFDMQGTLRCPRCFSTIITCGSCDGSCKNCSGKTPVPGRRVKNKITNVNK